MAQARPTTGPTAHPEDAVGMRVAARTRPQLRRAVVEGRICRDEEPHWHLEVPVRSETIPVRHDGAVVAVLSRDANLAMPRVPSPLEIAYLGSASDLCQMVADGTFPPRAAVVGADTSPRAGDGVIRLDALGLVAYASPNALSAYHRMGHASDLVGLSLATGPAGWWPTRSTPPRSPPASRARSRAGTRCAWRSRRGARPCWCGPCRCGLGATRRVRWCSCATSPTCAAATRPCCPRTPRSARSTTA